MENRCPQCGASLPGIRQLKVGDVMTRDPVTLGPEDSLMRGLEVMRIQGIRRIPIVVADKLVGLLAEGDLKRAQPSTLSESQEDFDRVMNETSISRIMIAAPITVTADAPLHEAAHTLAAMKFGALPVVDQGRLIGILTDTDLVRFLADLLGPNG